MNEKTQDMYIAISAASLCLTAIVYLIEYFYPNLKRNVNLMRYVGDVHVD